MKLLYKPFGIVIGLLGGVAARQVFSFIWSKLDDEDAPTPTTEITPWRKLLLATALQGAVFAMVKAIFKRGGAKGFAGLTGVWPGERRPDPA